MPKVTYTAAQGLVQSAGSGISFTVGSSGLSLDSLPFSPVQANSANVTIAQPGVYTLSSSNGTPVTGTMPRASAVPGGLFVFRNLSADTNLITGSAELGGTRVFKSVITGSETQTVGSKLQLAATIGNSVALLSDGKNFLILNSSGTLTFSGN